MPDEWPVEIDFYRKPGDGQIAGWADDPVVRRLAKPASEGGPYEIQTYVPTDLHADLRERPKPGSVLVELTEEEAESVLTRIAESFHMEDGNPEADCVTCQAKAKLRAALSTSTKGGEGK